MVKKSNKIERIILIICLSILIILSITIFITKHNSIDPESKLVKNAYALLGDNNLELCEGFPFYQAKEITYSNLNRETRLCLAYRMLGATDINEIDLNKTKKSDYCYLNKEQEIGFRVDDEKDTCKVQIITKDSLNKKYNELFGKNIEENIDFALSGSKTCYYNEEKGSYTCGNMIKQTYELGWAPTTYRVINKVKEKNNKLYIYDYYVMINNDKCYQTYDGLKENIKCSDKYTEDTQINSRFVIKNGVKYVHIFEKNKDGNYFWTTSKLN